MYTRISLQSEILKETTTDDRNFWKSYVDNRWPLSGNGLAIFKTERRGQRSKDGATIRSNMRASHTHTPHSAISVNTVVGRFGERRLTKRAESIEGQFQGVALLDCYSHATLYIFQMDVDTLIAAVHKRPILWNQRSTGHRNVFVLKRLWAEVADELGTTGK